MPVDKTVTNILPHPQNPAPKILTSSPPNPLGRVKGQIRDFTITKSVCCKYFLPKYYMQTEVQ